jgi:hypothetical protein
MTAVYEASRVKRVRSTKVQLAALDDAIYAAAAEENPVTLRGVYYRVVSAGAVEKTEAAYDKVGRRLLALRRSGRVPYDWITDGTRWVIRPKTYSDLDQMLDDAQASYRRGLWHDQNIAVHIFTEKDAISGVVSQVTEEWDVPLGVLRGYASESFAWSMAQSITASLCRGKVVHVYQLGDHDPSGVDAWRDFQKKVMAFVIDEFAPDVHDAVTEITTFERIAVTPMQIALYDLPTRPTKTSDSRSAKFAGESVEVDAIRPTILRQIVRDAITQHIDAEALRLTRIAEDSERNLLYAMRGQSA